ncbi:hypothetical protein [Arthrobacter sp. NtRootA1]|nr:hypothetical protein [Arthrobacter sp. NtRootA1]
MFAEAAGALDRVVRFRPVYSVISWMLAPFVLERDSMLDLRWIDHGRV